MHILYRSLKVKNVPKLISRYWKDNMQNGAISELYTDDKKAKYSSNTNSILKSAKNFYQKLYTKRKPLKLPLLTFDRNSQQEENLK